LYPLDPEAPVLETQAEEEKKEEPNENQKEDVE